MCKSLLTTNTQLATVWFLSRPLYSILWFMPSHRGQILTIYVSNDVFSCKRVLFWVIMTLLPKQGGPVPKNILGSSTGIFKPKSQNITTRILSKLLHQFQPNLHYDEYHQILFMGGPS